ncbi:MAG TPA: LacI family DNA-binding transcriptional regulator [Kouleothrix sp.]|uniref:LacI family DNA-binding transcriptional regulator n=1 Tax=Kouleothrix sp. TaxID=2779161 RepID=UPI002BEF7EF8|nr:LacI family DNA-binding transcriptional regulator [Kouleothrix sp.]
MGKVAKGRPTQHDVARLAGVSRAAVSHVLTNNSAVTIPAETRERIYAAMRELGYVPDRSAQSLRTRKTYTIASIIPDITNPFYPAFQRGIQDVALQHGYDLVMYNTDGDIELERKCLESAHKAGVDGLIVVLFNLDLDALRPLVESGVSVVAIAGPDALNLPVDRVYVDNGVAARAAVEYLIECGHRDIAMLAGVEENPPRLWRIQGYHAALAAQQPPLAELLIEEGPFNEVGGYQGARALLARNPRPTAIFAANDLMAIGAMKAIREAGLAIPDDIAVVGFDNISAAELVSPQLTTIAQSQEQMGRSAAALLFSRIAGEAPDTPRIVELPFELIIRASA